MFTAPSLFTSKGFQQRGMTWNMFLSLLYIFKTNEKTAPMVELFDIETDELKAFITK